MVVVLALVKLVGYDSPSAMELPNQFGEQLASRDTLNKDSLLLDSSNPSTYYFSSNHETILDKSGLEPWG